MMMMMMITTLSLPSVA